MMPSSCFSNGFVKERSIITQAGCDKNQKTEKRLYENVNIKSSEM